MQLRKGDAVQEIGDSDEPLFPAEKMPDETWYRPDGNVVSLAISEENDEQAQTPFRVTTDAVLFLHEPKEGAPEYRFLCPRLDILGATRNAESEDWGRRVRFQDADGKSHELTIAAADLVRDGGLEVLTHLARLGFRVPLDRAGKAKLADYLFSHPVATRLRSASRVGWQADDSFVLPDQTFGSKADERVIWQQEGRTAHPFASAGDLETWQSGVAERCAGNSRLVFVLSAAFAGPLLHLLAEESGGLHLRGPSSCGKTTALHVAASVWGRTVRTWRATDNALEAVAAAHSDTLLCLDELGQADARAADAAAYMLGNGSGKARANQKGGARQVAEWRLLFVSTGEVSLADKLGEQGRGRTTKAGQEVRLLDLEADAGHGMGAFEELHGAADPCAFADALKRVVGETYGTAGPAFVEGLVDYDRSELVSEWRGFKSEFAEKVATLGADGQVKRGAGRFALIGFAGELAVRLGIVPWDHGEALRAATSCFRAWIDGRGGSGSVEARQAIERIQNAVLTQRGRFQPWDGSVETPRDRLGFYKEGNDGGFFFHGAAFKAILSGLNEKQALKVLEDAGLLRTYTEGDGKRLKGKLRVPATGSRERLVHILPTVTEWEVGR